MRPTAATSSSTLSTFQSTHPLTRMPRPRVGQKGMMYMISIHALPHKNATAYAIAFNKDVLFQSTRSLARMRLMARQIVLSVRSISIHALPRKNATDQRSHQCNQRTFQSTHSLARMRRRRRARTPPKRYFNPRTPSQECDLIVQESEVTRVISIHALPRKNATAIITKNPF